MKLIVAVDEHWGIGRNNGLLFSLPEDMAYFREKTQDKVVVMGRKTLESFPSGQPLKNRVNIVLSQNSHFAPEGVVLCRSIGQLQTILTEYNNDDVFVIGGRNIYKTLLPNCDTAYITKIYADGNADTFFPSIDKLGNWDLVEESEMKEHNGIQFRFCVYHNTSPTLF